MTVDDRVFRYVECDLPPDVTLHHWRRLRTDRTSRNERRIVRSFLRRALRAVCHDL
jgi:hypothetical protein